MSIAHLQDLAAVGSTSAVSSLQSGAFGSSITAGSSILVFVWFEDSGGTRSVSSVTDTNGNTYTRDGGAANAPDRCDVWRKDNATAGSGNKITVQTSGAAFISFTAAEFSVTASSLSLDGAGSTNTGATQNPTVTPGAFSTTNANDLLIDAFAIAGMASATTPTSFNLIGKNTTAGSKEDGAAFYQIVSSTQTGINPSSTVANSGAYKWACIALAYQEPGGAAAQVWPYLDTEGAGGFCDMGTGGI